MDHIMVGTGYYHGKPVTAITDLDLKYFVVDLGAECMKVKGMTDEDVSAVITEYKRRQEKLQNVDDDKRDTATT
jgi:hypothetical protein